MNDSTTNERLEHYAQMLIEELLKPNTRLSLGTDVLLRKTLGNGARGNLRPVNTLSGETENVSTMSENAALAIRELDSMKACILLGWDVSTGSTLSDTRCHGGTVRRVLTMTVSMTNGDGPSESKRVQCVECPACNEAGKCLGLYRES